MEEWEKKWEKRLRDAPVLAEGQVIVYNEDLDLLYLRYDRLQEEIKKIKKFLLRYGADDIYKIINDYPQKIEKLTNFLEYCIAFPQVRDEAMKLWKELDE